MLRVLWIFCLVFLAIPADSLDLTFTEVTCTVNLEAVGEIDFPVFYCHVPCLTIYQIPLKFEIISGTDNIKGYRFLDYGYNRWMAVIYLNPMSVGEENSFTWRYSVIHWQADYTTNLPASIPLHLLSELPDSVKEYLQPSELIQWDHPAILEYSELIDAPANDVIALARAIIEWLAARCSYKNADPENDAVDAVTMLRTRKGNCSSYANAAAALLRAKGIPTKVEICAPWGDNPVLFHSVISTFMPGFGWVYGEPQGAFPHEPIYFISMYSCQHDDEIQIIKPCLAEGAEGYWAFQPALTMPSQVQYLNLQYSMKAVIKRDIEEDEFKELHRDLKSAHEAFNKLASTSKMMATQKDVNLTKLQYLMTKVELAFEYGNTQNLLSATQNLRAFSQIIPEVERTLVFGEDFENFDSNNWTFSDNLWAVGTPWQADRQAHSGQYVLGVGLNDYTGFGSKGIVQLPTIDLTGFSSATLRFWVHNQLHPVFDGLFVQFMNENDVIDLYPKLIGGVYPISEMIGGHWKEIIIDLAPALASSPSLKLQFSFQDSSFDTYSGTLIDDLTIEGLKEIEMKADQTKTFMLHVFPNPFSKYLFLNVSSAVEIPCIIGVFNIQGQLIDRIMMTEPHAIWDSGDLVSGMYYLVSDYYRITKVIKIK